MTYEQIIGDLKNKIYHPVYFLMGEEPYYIDLIANYIQENVLSDAEKSFNQTVFYGKDSEVGNIINASKRFPMMANQQVIIVKEAQELKKIDDLVHYVEKPLKSTILVISYKYKVLDKRKKLYTSLKKNAVIFESPKLYDSKIPDWINTYLKQKSIISEPKVSFMLSEYLGNNLSKIANEIDKLMLSVPDGANKITAELVERNIGISKDYNNFELQNALTKRDVLKANQIVDYFGKNPKDNPLQLTIISLFGYFSKLLTYHFLPDKSKNNVASALKVNPFFVNSYMEAARKYNTRKTVANISLLREYDLKSKGVNNSSTPPEELLRELIFKLMH